MLNDYTIIFAQNFFKLSVAESKLIKIYLETQKKSISLSYFMPQKSKIRSEPLLID